MTDFIKERPLLVTVVAFVAGLLIGWFLIGYVIAPVNWTDANPALLRSDFQADYIKMTADLYSYTLDQAVAKERLREWPDVELVICEMANNSTDGLEKQSLLNLSKAIDPNASCELDAGETAETETEATETTETTEEQKSSLLGQIALLCVVGLLALALVGGAFYLISRRSSAPADDETAYSSEEMATVVPAGGGRTIPLAQFPTEYNIGHDTYDDSFSIETATGEFLGECGVGISEAIGVGDPKKVTAFEVWLFDKNDIRTVTKVIMSNHAYHDDALRAKLAPKGEAVLAQPGETVVLETASLIINARIVELEYGAGELPPQSFFGRMVVELAAWAKDAPPAANAANPGAEDFAL